jgi:hypothetical protein
MSVVATRILGNSGRLLDDSLAAQLRRGGHDVQLVPIRHEFDGNWAALHWWRTGSAQNSALSWLILLMPLTPSVDGVVENLQFGKEDSRQ